MAWTPLGPTMVIAPKDPAYTRMARENETGDQAAVLGIAVNPNDQTNVIAVVRRVGGTVAFITSDDGHSWTPISDALTQTNSQLDICCAAFHPFIPGLVYLGARAGRLVFSSPDGGQTWSAGSAAGGQVTQLIVDRSSDPNDWTRAVLYAATDAGFAWSTDGGSTWSLAAVGEVDSLAVYMPLSGTRQFYAGVYGFGLLYYAGAYGAGLFPAGFGPGSWQNLFGAAGTGLPSAGSIGADFIVLVDYCPRQPDRVYAMLAPLQSSHLGPGTTRLFVSTAAVPNGAWGERGAGAQPQLDYGLEGISFLVAPESNGPDTQDVLLCSAGVFPQRSIDGGRTWQPADYSQTLHVDTRALAHFPPKTAYYTDTLPLTAAAPGARVYVGCDGGLGASLGYSNPAFGFASPVSDPTYNSGASYDPSDDLIQNLDHGLAAVAAFQFASNPDPLGGGPMSLVGYSAALDTGIARRVGSPAWAAVGGGDAGLIFASPTADGVQVWANMSADILWPTWNKLTWTDQDPSAGAGPAVHVTTPSAASCGATSNMVPAEAGAFYAGILAMEQVTTLQLPAASGTDVVVTPVTMTPDLIVGARVCLGAPQYGFVYQPITSVTATTFTVTILNPGPFQAGTAVCVARSWVGLVTGTGALPISQAFVPQTMRLYRLAKSGNSLLAASADQNLWLLASTVGAGAGTVWTPVTGAPASISGASIDGFDTEGGEFESGVVIQGSSPIIASLAADSGGTFYVMLSSPTGPSNTPLFSVQSGAWTPETCMLPANALIPAGVAVGEMIADPTTAGRLYVARNARVFQLDKGAAGWTWTDLTDNLPGQEIHDLWVGNVAPAGQPARTMLRALTAVRGVWEMELGGPGAPVDPLYFRDHAFDPGWLGPSVDAILSPLNSSQVCSHWQSPDILVDTPLYDDSSALYYQNDPEAPSPTAGDYAWFKDRSQGASAGVTARVWVRVNSRNAAPAGAVNVWVITAPFSAGLPLLPAAFWSAFHSDGTIDPTVLSGSGWTSLGVQSVSGIRAEAPGIAGFQMATGAQGDHRCIAAFVHGPGALLDTPGLSFVIDEAASATPQVAQRNVLVGAPLPPGPGTPGPTGSGGPVGEIVLRGTYIEFHNPNREAVETTVKFDLRGLPRSAVFEFRLSRAARPGEIVGARPSRTPASRAKAKPARRAKRKPAPDRLQLERAAYAATGGGVAEVRGVALKPRQKAAAELTLRLPERREPGALYWLDVLQIVKGKVIGGATIQIPVAGFKPGGPPLVNWQAERDSAGELERR